MLMRLMHLYRPGLSNLFRARATGREFSCCGPHCRI